MFNIYRDLPLCVCFSCTRSRPRNPIQLFSPRILKRRLNLCACCLRGLLTFLTVLQ